MTPAKTTSWKVSVESALARFAARHKSAQVSRAAFMAEELATMLAETGSVGRTPAQTVSRVLQELRDEGHLFFSNSGSYTINGVSIDATAEDIPEDVLEHAVTAGVLTLPDVETSNPLGMARLRRGMQALRRTTLRNYGHRCALCDIDDGCLLVTSHVARWADDPGARGRLSNTICFCGAHDLLFEHGYFALSDDLAVLWRPSITSRAIGVWAELCTSAFRSPKLHAPAEEYLLAHRTRVGL